MGYNTHFQLDVDQKRKEIISYLQNHAVTFFAYDWMVDFVIKLLQDEDLLDDCKWYTHREDLTKLSVRFPDVLFTLSGEESGDIWKLYIRNGKYQLAKAEILIADFDESKLRD